MSKENSYKPSEEILKECGFEDYSLKYLYFSKNGFTIYYHIFTNEFMDNNTNLNIESDTDLKTFIKIITTK